MRSLAERGDSNPAGTRPVQFLIPAGTLSVKQIAIGGKESLMEAVNV